MNQLELFAAPVAEVRTVPTVDSVRARLRSMLQSLRDAGTAQSPKTVARWKLIVPQMADWLPPQEADAVRVEFATLVGDV
jgi:hypothetical protein